MAKDAQLEGSSSCPAKQAKPPTRPHIIESDEDDGDASGEEVDEEEEVDELEDDEEGELAPGTFTREVRAAA